MKRLKFLSFILCAFAALAFTSCLSDDDDDTRLTPEQIRQCYTMTAGTHQGRMYYREDQSSDNAGKTDTVNVQWSINSDSTMVLQNIPSAALAAGIRDANVKAAVGSSPSVDIPCFIGFFTQNPIKWLINPQTVTFTNVSYGGASHKVDVVFYVQTYYSYGEYNASTGNMGIQIVVAAAYLDGNTGSSLLDKAYPLTFLKR